MVADMYTNDYYDSKIAEISDAAPDYRKSPAENTGSSWDGYQDKGIPVSKSCGRIHLAIALVGGAFLVLFSVITATLVLHFSYRSQSIEASANQDERLANISNELADEIKQLRSNQNDIADIHASSDMMWSNISQETRKKLTILQERMQDVEMLGAIFNPGNSCLQIKHQYANSSDGLYYLKDSENNVFQTYCDMSTAGGGWTLVASVHENNMNGKCTTGDRWSSEQGNHAGHPHGDGFWENRAIHGSATSASSDDYKNSGYFAMNAHDIMIWQVPNDTPVSSYKSSAFLRYRTTNGFLRFHGGNMASLFSVYKIRSKQYTMDIDNGPYAPIVWDIGDNNRLLAMYGDNAKQEVIAGYIQFRAVNSEGDAFALCPGVKARPGYGNIEHSCIGSTSNSPYIGHCGDYAYRDDPNPGYSLSKEMIESVVMIFYK